MAKKSQDETKEVQGAEAKEKGKPVLSFPLAIPRSIEKQLRKDHGLSLNGVYFLVNVKDNTMEIYKK